MSRLKPIGATTTASPLAILPATDASIWLSPGAARGKLSSSHKHHRDREDDRAGAAQENPGALEQADGEVLERGIWYLGSSMMKPEAAPLVTDRRSTSATTIAPTMPAR